MSIVSNVGTVDRALRLALGIGLIAATLLGYIGVWGWIGVVPLLTALFSFCPLYRIFSFSSVDSHME
ncbi:membrane protein [Duganella caerulea]|uniref:YgaP family membrane protein n=1 Tax=Duganella caerulea TaxID=2885762 RepID=UPI0030EA802D